MQLLSAAKASSTHPFSFTRASRAEASIEKNGAHVFVESYQPKEKEPWRLVSVDQRAPTSSEAAAYRKERATRWVPNYERTATYLADAVPGPAEQARPVFHFKALPKGTVMIDGNDLSRAASGDILVNNQNKEPFVEEIRVRVNEPARIKLLVKIDHWESTIRYRLGSNGTPLPSQQTSDVTGSLLGKTGTIHTVVTYSDIHLLGE